jgi:predicted enzyme related to lactoylglutathione lyase
VADTDAVVRRANETGGKGAAPTDMLYGRLAMLTDPFGTEFSVITRPGG